MKWFRYSVMVLVMLALVAVAAIAQDDEEEMLELPDLEGATVTIAIENAYPPFSFIDEETGEPAGWDYDVVEEICDRLNCTPEFIQTSWDGMIVAVSNGEFDMATNGITITEERAEIVAFSDGYARIIQRMMIVLDEDRFETVEEFVEGDFVIGVQTGTTNFLTAQELVGDERLVAFDQFGAAIQALIAGDVDGVVIDDVAGQGYVGEADDQIELLEDEISSDGELGFIYPLESELVEPFNMALESLIADGTLTEINESYGFEAVEIEDEMMDEDMDDEDMEEMDEEEMEATEEADD